MSSLNEIYRKRWLISRQKFERLGIRTFPFHADRKVPRRDPLGLLLKILRFLLRVTGVLKIGKKLAQRIELNHNRMTSSKVGTKSLKILHLSDLHLDESFINLDLLSWKIKEAGHYHFAVVTGDLVTGWSENNETLNKIKELIKLLKPQYETLLVLGNHDSYKSVVPLESLGVKVLTNQIFELAPDDFSYGIQFIGTDDPHYFFTDDALKIMQEAKNHFLKIALIHSPELYRAAEEQDIDIYLCGHTHAGQIALPGGYAPMKRIYRGKQFYKGSWVYKKMKGYTSSGLGTSTIEARFFTRAEITLHEITNKRN